ncbi:uncharacterized protein PAC_03059 [Phialocephala subalpina]|uniref:Uncharacterized protein n=1 Tax=Phialocephala subalpina TaxID=576137 RepID=A0A1L7WK83_9HELO|nr:uncharacterized protein PAC_03059 [Phialocephala subalpina]
MFNLRKRLGASILLTVLSLVSITLLLPSSKVKQLQKVTLGTTIEYSNLWKWGASDDVVDEEEDNGNGIRLVIFGDSWVDDLIEDGHGGKGNNWPQVLCEEINCTSRLNFAASQPSDAWPSSPPTGVMASNEIHEWAVSQNQFLRGEEHNYTAYPDLASQIQSYISLPAPKTQPSETIFILSFGFWDIYDFARLDFIAAQNVTDTSVDFIFDQLDILYAHFATNLYPFNALTPVPSSSITTSNQTGSTSANKFKVIIPRIFEPTLLPGWISQRPVPPKPSSVAEQQKNAVYLTERWNQAIENKMGAWMERKVASVPAAAGETETESRADVRENATEREMNPGEKFEQFGSNPANEEKAGEKKEESEDGKKEEDTKVVENLPKKDIFYHDTSSLILDLILEHQLEDEGLSDASGLGKGESPFDSVYTPCLRPLDLSLSAEEIEEIVEGWREVNGMLICKEPEEFLWWDAWNLGSKGKRLVGESVGEVVKEGRSLRFKMDNKGKIAMGH